MADIGVAPKSRGRRVWFWAAVAIVAVVGLLLWLAAQSERIDRAEAVAADSAAGGVQAVELPALAAAPDGYAGRPLSVHGVTVLASLGPRAFWADVPGRNPFLVVIGPGAADPDAPPEGQTVELEGTVHPLAEAQVDSLVQAGALNEASREEASFATHYLLATEVRQ